MTEIGETTTVQWDSALEAIERCYELGWTDGLPVVPPTEARVAEFIERTGRPSGEAVGELPERRREITVGKVAANAVMAGCLPEYMPVVLTATEAMLDPVFNLVGPSSSMGGSAILTIVNGPVVRELNINARNNLFGPGNRANSTIGRAIRLILINACASIPGLFDRSVLGHPGKVQLLHRRERGGHPLGTPPRRAGVLRPEQSAVTVFAGATPRQVRCGWPLLPRADARRCGHNGCCLVPGHVNMANSGSVGETGTPRWSGRGRSGWWLPAIQ